MNGESTPATADPTSAGGPASTTAGLAVAVLSAVSFGTSGAFVKPLLEAGWSPAAAVTARSFIAGFALLPFVLSSLRGRWAALWRARWRVVGMGVFSVAFSQVAYFAAVRRIPVTTALLVEYLSPVLLIAAGWARTRAAPARIVLAGSALAVAGLLLVIGPGALRGADPVGLLFAFGAAVGSAVYFVIAARPGDGLPPVAFAGTGLLLSGCALGLLGALGILPFTARFGDLPLLGSSAPWWVPLVVVGVVGTALAYATGITAVGILGTRVASFVALLEVASAALFAWLLLGEGLTLMQLGGSALILGGIAAVRAERPAAGAAQRPVAENPDPVASESVPGGLGPGDRDVTAADVRA